MTFNRTRLKVVAVAAATLMVAACSNDSSDMNKSTENQQVDVQSNNGENISGVNNPQMTETQLAEQRELETWYSKDAKGIEMYAGADRVLFAYDSDELTDAARRILQRQAEWLNHYGDVSVAIEGHCDERGTREYNLALGERRAIAVKNYLLALDVSADRLTTISYGKERPVEVGTGEGVWSKNRRGVLVIR
ncbi:peptidoglycan-associated lipoprotein Pal [Temperatibacter marinus]|uniref:Peptidoglycan-associated lipoprotein n=1 Tax=Temperatibacter marinus TaxID=1456591 RepID=A0AA52EDQ0_9PROT|nr:peptidoglycan-associated lipoprotein Pal [Temperatibacter marinus]WND02896.1 peptidoglycan-associated lipoprotein Pal [Temperatibacter marinus]